MSGAFGALGGDLSSIAVNPAGSAILSNGYFSLSFGTDNKSGQANLISSSNNFDKSNFTLNQIGGVINFENLDGDKKWNNADGLRLDQISAFENESITDAYVDIGNVYGYGHQQAFLGYESFITDPVEFNDSNSSY